MACAVQRGPSPVRAWAALSPPGPQASPGAPTALIVKGHGQLMQLSWRQYVHLREKSGKRGRGLKNKRAQKRSKGRQEHFLVGILLRGKRKKEKKEGKEEERGGKEEERGREGEERRKKEEGRKEEEERGGRGGEEGEERRGREEGEGKRGGKRREKKKGGRGGKEERGTERSGAEERAINLGHARSVS